MPGPEHLAAMIEAQEVIGQASVDHQIMVRRQMLAWACLLCSCSMRYSRGEPSWESCQVHGGFIITPDGRVI